MYKLKNSQGKLFYIYTSIVANTIGIWFLIDQGIYWLLFLTIVFFLLTLFLFYKTATISAESIVIHYPLRFWNRHVEIDGKKIYEITFSLFRSAKSHPKIVFRTVQFPYFFGFSLSNEDSVSAIIGLLCKENKFKVIPQSDRERMVPEIAAVIKDSACIVE